MTKVIVRTAIKIVMIIVLMLLSTGRLLQEDRTVMQIKANKINAKIYLGIIFINEYNLIICFL